MAPEDSYIRGPFRIGRHSRTSPFYSSSKQQTSFKMAYSFANLLSTFLVCYFMFPGSAIGRVSPYVPSYYPQLAHKLTQNAYSGSNTVSGVYADDTTQNVQYGQNYAYANGDYPVRIKPQAHIISPSAGGYIHPSSHGSSVFPAQQSGAIYPAPSRYPSHGHKLTQNAYSGSNSVSGIYADDTTQNVQFGYNTATTNPYYSGGSAQQGGVFPAQQGGVFPAQQGGAVYPARYPYQPSAHKLTQNAYSGSNTVSGIYADDTTQNVQIGQNYAYANSNYPVKGKPIGSGFLPRALNQNAYSGSNSVAGIYPGDTNQNVQYGYNSANTNPYYSG